MMAETVHPHGVHNVTRSHSQRFLGRYNKPHNHHDQSSSEKQSVEHPPQRTSHRHKSSGNSNSMSVSSKKIHSKRGHHKAEPHYDYDQFAGAEPGVNPRSGTAIAEYSHFKQDCVIEIMDYDSDEATFQRVTNEGLIHLLQQKTPVLDGKDDGDLPPRMVRWINIGGIDWGVLSALALKYNLHSLALEDILHERGNNQSKADYYPGHMFLRVLCHSVTADDSIPSTTTSPVDSPLAMSREASGQALANMTARTHGIQLEEGKYAFLPPSQVHTDEKGINSALSDARRAPPTAVPPTYEKGKEATRDGFRSSLKKRLGGLSGYREPAREKQLRQILALTKDERVCYKHEPLFIFLLRDGTVISIRPTPSLDYTAPITDRLHRPDSVLRTSEDSSLLVESLLDLIVDRILEMVDEYQVRIHTLEHDVLLRADMDTVRSLHILSGDLIMHKRTLDPLKTMIYGLRRYDMDRCLALAETMAMDTTYASDAESEATLNDPSNPTDGEDEHAEEIKRAEGRDKKSRAKRKQRRQRAKEKHRQQLSGGPAFAMMPRDTFFSGGSGGSNSSSASSRLSREEEERRMQRKMQETSKTLKKKLKGSNKTKKIEGYFSYKSKVYLADVYDHMDFALTSLDMFADITENLINYAFNMASYEMNTVMKRLTLVTIIFLPLTLLTGYFGMNFHTFWSVDQHSDAFFWEISVPVMAALIAIFLFDDIKKVFKYMRRRTVMQNAVKGLP